MRRLPREEERKPPPIYRALEREERITLIFVPQASGP